MQNLSQSIRFLEKSFDLLNQHFFENALSKPIITIQSSPKSNGHFSMQKIWVDNTESYHEINLSAENLNRPIQNTLATLLHEMIHMYCNQMGIKDTSRGETYHNKVFKTEAEKRGLKITFDKKMGHSLTEPTEELREFIRETKLDKEIPYHRTKNEKTKKGAKKKSSTRKYTCPECGQTIRATKEVKVICGDCMILMENENEREP